MREQGTTATTQLRELSLDEVVEIAVDAFCEHMEHEIQEK